MNTTWRGATGSRYWRHVEEQEERRQWWRQLVAQQELSGVSVRAFCQKHQTSEHSFYQWRKRLAAQLPMKFALVETTARRSTPRW